MAISETKALLGKYRLAHQRSKGSQEMEPILTLVDINNALKLLVRVQPQCAVNNENLKCKASKE